MKYDLKIIIFDLPFKQNTTLTAGYPHNQYNIYEDINICIYPHHHIHVKTSGLYNVLKRNIAKLSTRRDQ